LEGEAKRNQGGRGSEEEKLAFLQKIARQVSVKERRRTMEDRGELKQYLLDVIGEEGCGVSCTEADVFKDEEGWKMMLEGFMEPWYLGKTVPEAREKIKEYASQGFGLA